MSTEEKTIRQTYNVFMSDDDILVFELLGGVNSVEENVLQAQLIKNDIESFIEEGKNIKLLVDLTLTGQNAHYPTPAAKKFYNDIINNNKIEKIGFVIKNFLLNSIIRFIIGSKKMSESKVFKTKKEAISWLKNSNQSAENLHIEPE